jgi:hypothetical protein
MGQTRLSSHAPASNRLRFRKRPGQVCVARRLRFPEPASAVDATSQCAGASWLHLTPDGPSRGCGKLGAWLPRRPSSPPGPPSRRATSTTGSRASGRTSRTRSTPSTAASRARGRSSSRAAARARRSWPWPAATRSASSWRSTRRAPCSTCCGPGSGRTGWPIGSASSRRRPRPPRPTSGGPPASSRPSPSSSSSGRSTGWPTGAGPCVQVAPPWSSSGPARSPRPPGASSGPRSRPRAARGASTGRRPPGPSSGVRAFAWRVTPFCDTPCTTVRPRRPGIVSSTRARSRPPRARARGAAVDAV